jgi:hypothetical protein
MLFPSDSFSAISNGYDVVGVVGFHQVSISMLVHARQGLSKFLGRSFMTFLVEIQHRRSALVSRLSVSLQQVDNDRRYMTLLHSFGCVIAQSHSFLTFGRIAGP